MLEVTSPLGCVIPGLLVPHCRLLSSEPQAGLVFTLKAPLHILDLNTLPFSSASIAGRGDTWCWLSRGALSLTDLLVEHLKLATLHLPSYPPTHGLHPCGCHSLCPLLLENHTLEQADATVKIQFKFKKCPSGRRDELCSGSGHPVVKMSLLPNHIPARVSVTLKTLILKFMWKVKGHGVATLFKRKIKFG